MIGDEVRMKQSLQQGIEKAAEVLKEAGAKEVYVFGSAAEGRATPHSDIDLAVKGLPPEAFFQAIGRVAMEISRGFDLVDMDERNPFTEYLERRGKLTRVV
jgi:predicted nucleotidyltransferase